MEQSTFGRDWTCADGEITCWEREKLWKLSPALLSWVSEQYEAFSRHLMVPMPSKQMEALIGMGDLLCRFEQGKKADFDACSQAVGKVYHVFLEQFLKKCRTTSDEEKEKNCWKI